MTLGLLAINLPILLDRGNRCNFPIKQYAVFVSLFVIYGMTFEMYIEYQTECFMGIHTLISLLLIVAGYEILIIEEK